MDDSLYREIILDRYQNPKNRGKIAGGVAAEEMNLLCGDKIKLTVRLEKGVVKEAKFEGGGCAISQAAVDLLLDEVKGKRLDQIRKMSGKRIEELLGVELTPSRKKCAYLGLEALKKIVI